MLRKLTYTPQTQYMSYSYIVYLARKGQKGTKRAKKGKKGQKKGIFAFNRGGIAYWMKLQILNNQISH